jgi:glycosyltransferase involved in cell wall biosynthesis
MPGGQLRVLAVSSFLPSRTSGGRVRLRALLRGLARSHSVSLLSFRSPTEGEHPAPEDIGAEYDVQTVPNERIGISGGSKRVLQLRSLLSTRTFERLTYDGSAFQAAIDRKLAESSFDVVHIEGIQVAHFAFPHHIPVVLDEQNIEYDVLRRAASVTRSLPRKLFTRLNAEKLRVEEQRAWRTVDACAVPSPRDEAIVREAVPHVLTTVVPNGVDLEFFAPAGRPVRPRTILFFGQLGYYPNTDALEYFLQESWPAIKRSVASPRLVVVGPSAPPRIQRWASDEVEITGTVPDVRPYLEEAAVVIVPLRIGGGTRLKILEAMAMRKAIVSTTLGAEGLAVTDGEDILLGDTADAFAAQVKRVLDDGELGARLGGAGRRLVEDRYGWATSVRSLEALYRSAIAARLGVPDSADGEPSSDETAASASATPLWRARNA